MPRVGGLGRRRPRPPARAGLDDLLLARPQAGRRFVNDAS